MTAGRRLRVTVWNEYVHERGEESVKRIYPDGMHRPIADGIRRELGDGVSVRIATLEEPEHGLTEEALAETDVMTWWGHAAHDEMYGEFFDIPTPDELVFISSFEGGEVFRSGCCYHRGAGRVAYFSPGDQEYPVYHQPEIQRAIANCVAWCGGAAASNDAPERRSGNAPRDWFIEPGSPARTR